MKPGAARATEAAFAIAVITLGIGLAAATAQIPVVTFYAKVGPHLFPYLVAGALCLVGFGLLVQVVTGQAHGIHFPPMDRAPLAIVAVALVLQVTLFELAGFVLSTAVMFTLVALAFGERRVLRSLTIGLVLCMLAHIAFTRGLGLTLPAGPLEALL